jgi:hypothetical protein
MTFESVAELLRTALRTSSVLSYTMDDSIVISSDKETIPQFRDYLIKITPPDSNFESVKPRIGRFSRKTYTVVVELYIKSSLGVGDRMLKGRVQLNKGIYDFWKDVHDILEHNTFSNQLDPYPGSNWSEPVMLKTNDTMIIGIQAFWFGNKDN